MTRRAASMTICAALVVTGAFAAPAQAARKPDLVISAFTGDGNNWAFQGSPTNASFAFTVKNQGTAPATRSVAKVFLNHGGDRYLLGTADIPGLGIGEKNNRSTTAVPGLDDGPLRIHRPLGAYSVEVCADADKQVTEGNSDQTGELNNCDFLTAPAPRRHFYVARRTWAGTFDGKATVPGYRTQETWYSKDAKFTTRGALYDGNGVFTYEFAGSVTWEDSGTDAAGCKWNGSGTGSFGTGAPAAGDGLEIDYLREKYHGYSAATKQMYTINTTCGGKPGYKLAGPQVGGDFWDTGRQGAVLVPFPFGSNRLDGAGRGTGYAQSWNWNLGAPSD